MHTMADWFQLHQPNILEKLKQKSLMGNRRGEWEGCDILSLGSLSYDDESFKYTIERAKIGTPADAESTIVQKVYPPESSAYHVGWVVEESVTFCMICAGKGIILMDIN